MSGKGEVGRGGGGAGRGRAGAASVRGREGERSCKEIGDEWAG